MAQSKHHIWCNTWYGHHIIGQDCEWYADPDPTAFENALKQEPVQAVMMVIMRYLTDEQRKIVWEKLGRRVDQSTAITDQELGDEAEKLYPIPRVVYPDTYNENDRKAFERSAYICGRQKSIARERELRDQNEKMMAQMKIHITGTCNCEECAKRWQEFLDTL
jgi:hypothetical protein